MPVDYKRRAPQPRDKLAQRQRGEGGGRLDEEDIRARNSDQKDKQQLDRLPEELERSCDRVEQSRRLRLEKRQRLKEVGVDVLVLQNLVRQCRSCARGEARGVKNTARGNKEKKQSQGNGLTSEKERERERERVRPKEAGR